MIALKKNSPLVLYGPTGVGKSDIAIAIARQIPAEIINMDMGQCYLPLSIGTAKPDWRSMDVPHHLFDLIDQPINFTVTQYRTVCLEQIQRIWQLGKLPILVGGSGFYLRSLFFPPTSDSIIVDAPYDTSGSDEWQQLYAVDPDRAQKIHKNDLYRIRRALAIWNASGKKPSEYVPIYNPPTHSYVVHCLLRDRAELYRRIDSRVLAMMQEGWITETAALRGTAWEEFLSIKKIIGYDDILAYLAGDQSQEQRNMMMSAIQQKTRNYAKRQMTFWRKLEKELNQAMSQHADHADVAAINLTLLDVDLYIKQLLEKLATLCT